MRGAPSDKTETRRPLHGSLLNLQHGRLDSSVLIGAPRGSPLLPATRRCAAGCPPYSLPFSHHHGGQALLCTERVATPAGGLRTAKGARTQRWPSPLPSWFSPRSPSFLRGCRMMHCWMTSLIGCWMCGRGVLGSRWRCQRQRCGVDGRCWFWMGSIKGRQHGYRLGEGQACLSSSAYLLSFQFGCYFLLNQ